jgi:hypothetical protein
VKHGVDRAATNVERSIVLPKRRARTPQFAYLHVNRHRHLWRFCSHLRSRPAEKLPPPQPASVSSTASPPSPRVRNRSNIKPGYGRVCILCRNSEILFFHLTIQILKWRSHVRLIAPCLRPRCAAKKWIAQAAGGSRGPHVLWSAISEESSHSKTAELSSEVRGK